MFLSHRDHDSMFDFDHLVDRIFRADSDLTSAETNASVILVYCALAHLFRCESVHTPNMDQCSVRFGTGRPLLLIVRCFNLKTPHDYILQLELSTFFFDKVVDSGVVLIKP